ncbi:MAG TPA: RHS repeat-associated core domain-containing protein [Acidimicrobiales bacterium]|jgi:RHS repeat-associated protein
MTYNGVDQASSITAAAQSPLAMTYAGTTNAERTAAGSTTSQNGLLGVQTQATAGATTTFVRDPQGTLLGERMGADEYYYVFDGIGSVIALVDANGIQRAAYTYDPYGGNATATALNGALPDNPFRFAGGHLDSSGLYHFGARYYDPKLGRWTQQDSVVSVGDPANANRYAYAADDPVNLLDAAGRDLVDVSFEGCFGVCLSGGVTFDTDGDLPSPHVGVGVGPDVGVSGSATAGPGDITRGVSVFASCVGGAGGGVKGEVNLGDQGVGAFGGGAVAAEAGCEVGEQYNF